MALGSSMLATMRTEPPQWMQVLTSMLTKSLGAIWNSRKAGPKGGGQDARSKTRLRRCAKGHRAVLSVGATVVAVGPSRRLVRRRTFAAPRWRQLRAPRRVRRKDAVGAGQVRPRRRHQCRQFGDDESAGLPIWTTAGRPQGGAQGCAPSSRPAQTPRASCRSSTASSAGNAVPCGESDRRFSLIAVRAM